MNINDIIKEMEKFPSAGLQLSKKKGIMNTTWALYKIENSYYYFDISEKFIFDNVHRYSLEELLDEFKGNFYEIDTLIL